MVNMMEVRDFSQDYQFSDFVCLVEESASEGIRTGIRYEDDGIGYIAGCLYDDYINKRANAFGYLVREMSGRTLMELRKTAVLQDMTDIDDSGDYNNVIQRRIDLLKPLMWIFVGEYKDENWQYDWAAHIFIEKEKREDFRFMFENYMVDGDLERDKWYDPLWQWRLKKCPI